MKNCSNCGAEMQDDVKFCPACGAAQNEEQPVEQQTQAQQQPYYGQPRQSYSEQPFPVFGLIGMIAGILGIIFVWIITWVGLAMAVIGIVFSSIGMAQRNKNKLVGLSIAGLVCSIIAVVVVIIAFIIVFIAIDAVGQFVWAAGMMA